MNRIRILAGVLSELEEPLRHQVSAQPDMTLLACVSDGTKLVEQLHLCEVDAVVVGTGSAQADALAVLDQICQLALHRPPKVLVVTPTGKDSIVRAVLEAGADYCLVKPLDPAVLGSRLRQIVSGTAVPHQTLQSPSPPGLTSGLPR